MKRKEDRKQRSMSEALASTEAMDFLREGDRSVENRAELKSVKKVAETTERKREKGSKSKEGSEELRVSVTFRLPASVANALIDLSAERRKARVKRRSQQDIVTEILEKWLKKEGILR